VPIDNSHHPGPLQRISPEGLPGFFVVVFVIFGFTTLFVSKQVAETLLWVMVAVILCASGIAAYRAVRHHP
jgi:hypothetical protein